MGYYTSFHPVSAAELTVKQNGFWKSSYEITNGQYSYGMLRYEGFWRSKIIIDTAQQTWVISGMQRRNITLNSAEGESLATTTSNFWGSKITFAAQDGFTATFVNTSIWKSIFVWKAIDGTELLSIKARVFNTPVITIHAQAKQNRWLLMLAFLALEIFLTRQRHAAAAS